MPKQKTVVVKDDKVLNAYNKKGNYSLISSPIKNEQLLLILQRTPKEHIYTRPAKGGGTWC